MIEAMIDAPMSHNADEPQPKKLNKRKQSKQRKQ